MPTEDAEEPVQFSRDQHASHAPGTPENPTPVTIEVNIKRVTSHLQNVLQFDLDAVRLCVEGIESLEDFSGETPESLLQLNPADNRRLSLVDLKRETRRWVLRNGFRDAVEAVSKLLENARDILAAWSLRGVVAAKDANAKLVEEKKTFHRLGLPAKLEFLAKTYDFTIAKGVQDILLGVNRARNCLAHRNGRVGPEDAGPTGSLELRWIRLAQFAEDKWGRTEIIGPTTLVEGDTLILARGPGTRSLQVGQPFDVTPAEFSEICYTLHYLGQGIKVSLARYGIARGF